MKKFLIVFLCFWGISNSFAGVGNFRAEVENKNIPYGETFTLSLTYEGSDGNSLQPDFSVLQKDFKIYGSSNSFESSMINGVVSQKRRWLLTLLPLKEGKITIPAIKAGSESSNSIDIAVLSMEESPEKVSKENNNSEVAATAKFKAKIEIANKDFYVQQAVPFKVKVYENRDMIFNREPWFAEKDEIIIKSVGRPTVTEENGLRVITFNYIAFPQKSGLISISPAQIEGYYNTYEKRRNNNKGFFRIFDMDMDMVLSVQKPVAFQSDVAVMDVKPIPAEYGDDWWLPAEALNVSAKWNDKKPVFKVGETVAREVIISAKGLSEAQFPELNLGDNPDWKQYPEKPQLSSIYDDNTLLSQGIYRVVYIPQKSGRQRLPKILIKWFNTDLQQIEIAEVNSELIDVEESSYQNIEEENPEQRQSVAASDKNEENKAQKEKLVGLQNNRFVIAVVAGAFICGLLFCLLLLWLLNAFNSEKNVKKLHSRIVADLKKRDYRALRDDLLLWGNKSFAGSPINNLNDLSEIIGDGDFKTEIQKLNENLYAGKTNILDGKVIAHALKGKGKKSKDIAEETPLPKLYK